MLGATWPLLRLLAVAAAASCCNALAMTPSPRIARHRQQQRCRLALSAVGAFPPASRYTWRGHSCSYVEAGSGPPVILLHGFAGSAFNCWRSTVPALAATNTVYGLDLLGLGASDQPSNVEYSIDLWREQCADFVRERLNGEAPIIIGHSFGSLVALELARELQAQGTPAKGVGMMNCAVGMNNKNALKVEEWRREQTEKGLPVDEDPGACATLRSASSPHGRRHRLHERHASTRRAAAARAQRPAGS